MATMSSARTRGLWLLIQLLDATTGSQEKVCSRQKHTLQKGFCPKSKTFGPFQRQAKVLLQCKPVFLPGRPPVLLLDLGSCGRSRDEPLKSPFKRCTLPSGKECDWLTASIRRLLQGPQVTFLLGWPLASDWVRQWYHGLAISVQFRAPLMGNLCPRALPGLAETFKCLQGSLTAPLAHPALSRFLYTHVTPDKRFCF